MKKTLKVLALSFVALVVLAVVIGYLLLGSGLKRAVEAYGPEMTKTKVTLQSASLSPFSGSGSLQGLAIGNPEGFKTDKAVNAGEIKTAIRISTVFSDPMVIESVLIDSAEINFEGGLGGSNLDKILKSVNEFCSKDQASPRKYIIKDFRVTNCKVNLGLALLSGKSFSVPLPDLHLTNVGEASGGETLSKVAAQIVKPLAKSVSLASTNLSKMNIGDALNLGGKNLAPLEKNLAPLKGLLKR